MCKEWAPLRERHIAVIVEASKFEDFRASALSLLLDNLEGQSPRDLAGMYLERVDELLSWNNSTIRCKRLLRAPIIVATYVIIRIGRTASFGIDRGCSSLWGWKALAFLASLQLVLLWLEFIMRIQFFIFFPNGKEIHFVQIRISLHIFALWKFNLSLDAFWGYLWFFALTISS